ncbi:hypothetical protein, partial [Escherichia coli]|uniref:hypothetical protein n=1 Tax=Escherichia coli TaxID=562 RepID=UPI001BDD770D
MMGRKSVFNGMIPNSIRWYGVDDICESIMREYDTRKSDSLDVAQSCFEFTIKPDNIFNHIPHIL